MVGKVVSASLSKSKVKSQSAKPERKSQKFFNSRCDFDFWLLTFGFISSAVSRGRSFLQYWLPVIVWMCLIFAASGDAMSSQHSSRIIEPILRWLFPRMPDATVHLLVFLIRKCAHLT